MRTQKNTKQIVVMLILCFILLVFSSVFIGQATDSICTNSLSACIDSHSILVAGSFQPFTITLDRDTDHVTILAYHTTSQDAEPQSIHTYYRWEYLKDEWQDTSGYTTTFIKPESCERKNNTFTFFIGLDAAANPGQWKIKIIVDEKTEITTLNYEVILGFQLFFSFILTVAEPPKYTNFDAHKLELLLLDRKHQNIQKIQSIQETVDEILSSQQRSKQCKTGIPLDIQKLPVLSSNQVEQRKTQISIYPKTKIKENTSENSFNIKKFYRGDEKALFHDKQVIPEKFSALLICVLLLSGLCFPFLVVIGFQPDISTITILNSQSYPVIGENWTVAFQISGSATLCISAVNGTEWSLVDDTKDLQFLEIKNTTQHHTFEWVDNVLFIENYSSNTTAFLISKVLTPGVHTLLFEFGDDFAYAHNLASEYWSQTTTSDFNNGIKTDVNVSSDSFHLNETVYGVNYSLVGNESFEDDWPPTDWTEIGNWDQESDEVHTGLFSADLDGASDPGASGIISTPAINCSDSTVVAIYVDFWNYADSIEEPEYYLDYYNGITWVQSSRLDTIGSGAWAQYTQKITDSQYFVSDFQIRWFASSIDLNEHIYIDDVNITVEKNEREGYMTTGSLISEAHDTGRIAPIYNNIVVNNNTPEETTVTTWVRSTDIEANLNSATWYTDITQVPNLQWVQWRINLTGDQTNTPTVYDVNLSWSYDIEAPISSVSNLSSFWYNDVFEITATASDNDTGVKEVALYYNYSADNSTAWTGWMLVGTNDTVSPYQWTFTFPDGDGYYRFISIAVDNSSISESAPSTPEYDQNCGVDVTRPTSQVDALDPYWYSEPQTSIDISVSSASDVLSGIQEISLYYRYRVDNGSGWDSWVCFGTDQLVPYSWSFNFPKSKGQYQFYSVALDNASNDETPPAFDTSCGYDTTKPYSELNDCSVYWYNTTPVNLTGEYRDFSGNGIQTLTLYYFNSTDNFTFSGPWIFGVDTDPWVQVNWSFTFPNTTGYYRLYSIAVDNDSNQEEFTGNDTYCGYDTTLPNSMIDSVSSYWIRTSTVDFFETDPSDTFSGIKNITLYHRYRRDNQTSWGSWTPFSLDQSSPWSWSFNFPDGIGHYEFYTRANDSAGNQENSPLQADSACYYSVSVSPKINSYDLCNSTGSKLNNIDGLLDVNNEYIFTVNVTDENGWNDIEYVDIYSWYDQGNDLSLYNGTSGGNLNMHVCYDNTTGIAQYQMLWPDDEAELITENCVETIYNETTHSINFSFKPKSQIRWADSNTTWDTTVNSTNDAYSWNCNITVTDAEGYCPWKSDEYGVYKYTSISPDQDWVDVQSAPGYSDTSNIVTITYSSNYDYNLTLYFEQNLTNITWNDTIPIKDNVYVLASSDADDDVTSDTVFTGIGESDAVDIINISGIFPIDTVSQSVDVQFRVSIALGTHWGQYTSRVATKITQD